MGAGAVPLTDGGGMYRAEHRALRELHATGRQLASHWWRLGDRLGGAPAASLQDGAAVARGMVTELAKETAKRGLHGFPAAQGVGSRLAGLRNTAGDLVLERNQALRLAVLDAEHVTTLLAYLAALADKRGDDALAAFHRRWEDEIAEARDTVRDAAIGARRRPRGRDPARRELDPRPRRPHRRQRARHGRRGDRRLADRRRPRARSTGRQPE